MGKFASFNCSNCFPNSLGSSVSWLAVLVAAFIVGTRHIILVPFIILSTLHVVVVYIHVLSVGQIVPAVVMNVFFMNSLGRPICWSFWNLSALESIDMYGRLLELLIQVSYGCGEVCDGFALGHHRVHVCHRLCCQVSEGIVCVLPIFSEVFCAFVSRSPGGNVLLTFLFMTCRLKVCLEVCPIFFGAFLIVPLVIIIVK